MSNIWFWIIPSIVVAYIGTKIKKPGENVFTDWKFPWGPATPCRFPGKIMFMAGAVCTLVGFYAALLGPVQLGSLTLPKSEKLTGSIAAVKEKKTRMADKYSRKTKVENKEEWASALEYAQKKVTITGGWHMPTKSKRLYMGVVHNRGDRELRVVTFSLKGKTENRNVSVSNIPAFGKARYSRDLGLHFWRMYESGPHLLGAQFK